jgi:hypothetical protein
MRAIMQFLRQTLGTKIEVSFDSRARQRHRQIMARVDSESLDFARLALVEQFDEGAFIPSKWPKGICATVY